MVLVNLMFPVAGGHDQVPPNRAWYGCVNGGGGRGYRIGPSRRWGLTFAQYAGGLVPLLGMGGGRTQATSQRQLGADFTGLETALLSRLGAGARAGRALVGTATSDPDDYRKGVLVWP